MTKPIRLLAVAALAALALTGCQPATEPTNSAAPAAPASSAPAAPAESAEPTIAADAPQRVAALSTEVSDLALEIVGPDRLIAVSEGSATEGTGNHVELAQQVENHLSVTQNPDPEQVLALNPDLVVLTGRHDDEQSLGDALEGSGVEVLEFQASDFASPEAVAASIETLGDALGAPEKAAQLANQLREDVKAITDKVAAADKKPKVLVLLARGGESMIMGANSATTNLVELAGGESLATTNDWKRAVPADPETIIAAAPDVILVQDFRGAGLGPFQELLQNPALAEVPAIANDGVHVIPSGTTSGTAGTRIDEGLAEIAKLLHPELM